MHDTRMPLMVLFVPLVLVPLLFVAAAIVADIVV